jgi:hypothetical protein
LKGKQIMRVIQLVAVVILMGVPAILSAQAHAAQVSPVRVEFTRPGGIPGAARVTVRSDVYMIAPVQPEAAGTTKRRKRR